MRFLPLLLLAVACPTPREIPVFEPPEWPEDETFVYEASLLGRAAGLAVGAGVMVVGFDGQTALLDPATLDVTLVEAAPGVNEFVLATDRTTSGPVALVVTDIDVRLVVFDGGGIRAPWPVTGVVDGDLVGEEPVVLIRGEDDECRVRWVVDEIEVGLGLECIDDATLTAVDRSTVVVSLGNRGVLRVTPERVTEIVRTGRAADWDGTDTLYITDVNETEIQVVDLDGSVTARIPAGGDIVAMTAMGDRGVAWAEDIEGRFHLRWASATGEDLGEVVHNEPILALAAAPDGVRLGVVRLFDIGSYEVGR